jgi:hypothetical protein
MKGGGFLVDECILDDCVPDYFENNMIWVPKGDDLIYTSKTWRNYSLNFQSIIEGKALIMFTNCLNTNDTKNTMSKETFISWSYILGLNNYISRKEFTKLIEKYKI